MNQKIEKRDSHRGISAAFSLFPYVGIIQIRLRVETSLLSAGFSQLPFFIGMII